MGLTRLVSSRVHDRVVMIQAALDLPCCQVNEPDMETNWHNMGHYCKVHFRSLLLSCGVLLFSLVIMFRGTTAAVPLPFRLGDPARCGSRDLLCFLYFCVICVFMFSFSTLILLVGSFDLLNCLPDNLYCVDGDVKHCSINQWPSFCHCCW